MLDEPSIGLHSRDTAKLIHILEELRDLGNTILVVEHDLTLFVRRIICSISGPGAGEFGGKLAAGGVRAEIEGEPDSSPAAICAAISDSGAARGGASRAARKLVLRGAQANNLKGIDWRSRWECWWPSPAFPGREIDAGPRCALPRGGAARWDQPDGADPQSRSIEVTAAGGAAESTCAGRSDRPSDARRGQILSRTSRRSISSVTCLRRSPRHSGMAIRRDTFRSMSRAGAAKCAKATDRHGRDAIPGRRGAALRRLQWHALSSPILEVQYKGKNIHEVLQMTVKEALRFFAGTPALDKLEVLDEVGLGYLRLGQSATTLSGARRSASNWRRICTGVGNATPGHRRPAACFTS